MTNKKTNASILAAALLSIATLASFACWYNIEYYTDYIYGVNNFERHTVATNSLDKTEIEYTVANNMVVDLPLTVMCKIVSKDPIVVGDGSNPEVLTGMLQYRVLPSGDWVTVDQFQQATGTIPTETPAAPYFGRNNIMPEGLHAGDVIMVRMYVACTGWQSGDLDSMCDRIKVWEHFNDGTASTWTLPDVIGPYSLKNVKDYDLGGRWAPHYVVTVIFSGQYRPIK